MSIINQLAPAVQRMFITAQTNDIFFEIGIIIIIATIFALVAAKLKQPLIPAYIIAGLIIGPIYGLITNTELIRTLSEIGIAFLLFIVGLEMDLKKIKDVSVVSGLGGTIRSISMFTIGFVIALILGFVTREAVYIGIIIAFSSTMVVIKLLSDKRELDTLHGRIVVGILLMEDILAIIALSFLSSLDGNSLLTIGLAIVKGLILMSAAIFIAGTIHKIFGVSAKNQELLFLTSISVCFLLSIISYFLGFSIAIGGFLAGLTLANLPYNFAIIGKVRSLRDFFATIFFVSLGMELVLGKITQMIIPIIILLIVVIIIKPYITLFLCSFFGYKRRVGFSTAISLAQISEFSLIIVSQGLLLGHISKDIFTLTIIVAIITITITSYLLKFENNIYQKFKSSSKIFDRFSEAYGKLEYLPKTKKVDIVLCGHNRIGYSIGRTIRKMEKKMMVVDYNPEIIKMLIKKRIPCIYGDVGDVEVIERLPLKGAKMIISTVPSSRINILLIEKIKEVNEQAIIYVTSSSVEKALKLYDQGADYVILPHFLGGEHVSLLVEEFSENVDKIIEHKLKHIKELEHRKSIGHEHPKHHPHEHED